MKNFSILLLKWKRKSTKNYAFIFLKFLTYYVRKNHLQLMLLKCLLQIITQIITATNNVLTVVKEAFQIENRFVQNAILDYPHYQNYNKIYLNQKQGCQNNY